MGQRKVSCEAYTDRGIVGKTGKSAYEQAVEGGYQGTEEEFEQILASSLNTVADNVEDINTVADSIEDVNTAADNIQAIIAAPQYAQDAADSASAAATSESNASTSETNAALSAGAALVSQTAAETAATSAGSSASTATTQANAASQSASSASSSATSAQTSATNAQKWAEGTDSEVTPLGGTHSSKGWANVAKQYAESIGAALKYKGSVSTYSALPSTGQEVGDMWNVLDTGKNYAWTGTEWDDLAGVVDLSAYRTAAQQDVIDGNLSTAITNHTGDTSNPHSVTKAQVGLGNVDNTADLDKPISTATQTALNAKQDTLVSGTNIKTVNGNSLLGSGNVDIDALPSQTGQSGKFLTTNGTSASWKEVDALPAQTGQQGKYLTTNGTTASWDIPMAGLPMFYATYQPRKLNNASWLRADPYSWHSADLYVSAYAHLVDGFNNCAKLHSWVNNGVYYWTTSTTPSVGDAVYGGYPRAIVGTVQAVGNNTITYNNTVYTLDTTYIYGFQEQIAGTVVDFYKLSDEIKVVLPDQQTNLDAIYNATGIGYYFVLDTTNRQFKLPRNIYGFTGYRGDVGGYVAESLPNIKGKTDARSNSGGASGAFIRGTSLSGSYAGTGSTAENLYAIYFDASRSSSTYRDNAPVQERAIQAYLYFYVGNTVQNETLVDAGEMTEALNDKVDKGHQVIAFQAPTAQNNYTWYRKYADGWVEQGGRSSAINGVDATAQIVLPITMSDSNYSAYVTISRDSVGAYRDQFFAVFNRTTAGFSVYSNWAGSNNGSQNNYAQWLVCGMAA